MKEDMEGMVDLEEAKAAEGKAEMEGRAEHYIPLL